MSNLLVKKITCCIICGSEERTKYLSLGEQAFANAYLRKEDLVKPESKLPLEVFWCHNCYLAYLGDSIDRSFLFEDYAYFSSTSPQLFEHFANYAEELAERFPEQMKQLTLEIASNDGILLKPCKERGARVLGVDPASQGLPIQKELRQLQIFSDLRLCPIFFPGTGRPALSLQTMFLPTTVSFTILFRASSSCLIEREYLSLRSSI